MINDAGRPEIGIRPVFKKDLGYLKKITSVIVNGIIFMRESQAKETCDGCIR